jgi:hypothetical protein
VLAVPARADEPVAPQLDRGGLAGGQIASRPELATMPIAAMFLGTAVATFPASMWMARASRRAGFVLGALLGVAGGLIADARRRRAPRPSHAG